MVGEAALRAAVKSGKVKSGKVKSGKVGGGGMRESAAGRRNWWLVKGGSRRSKIGDSVRRSRGQRITAWRLEQARGQGHGADEK